MRQQEESRRAEPKRDERRITDQWVKRSRSRRRQKTPSLTPPAYLKTPEWKEQVRVMTKALREDSPVTYPDEEQLEERRSIAERPRIKLRE